MSRPPTTPHDAPLKVDIEEYYGLAIYATARAHKMRTDSEEVYDWAMETLVRASQTFKPDAGLQFKSYLIQRCNWDSMRRFKEWRTKPEQKRKRRDLMIALDMHVSRSSESDRAEAEETKEELDTLMSVLNEREKSILVLRIVHRLTLIETGWNFGISKERTRQVEAIALKKIRTHIRKNKYKEEHK